MNWTMPYPWRSRSDSVRRINMSSEPGNESFFCALRPIPRILSLRRRDYASQVQIGSNCVMVMPRPRSRSTATWFEIRSEVHSTCRPKSSNAMRLKVGVKRQLNLFVFSVYGAAMAVELMPATGAVLIHPPYGLRSIRSTFQLLRQFVQPLLHPVRFDVLERLAVYACCSAVRFATFVGKSHHVFSVHLVVQSIEAKVGRSLRFAVQRLLQLLNT